MIVRRFRGLKKILLWMYCMLIVVVTVSACGCPVVDARTEEAIVVEHEMTGYENDEKKRDILPIIKDKLIMAAKCVATSRR
ncbi:hypothetical protein KOY48_03540 [Candidatus Minimicrobia naudis]|uniref:Uncharacterized protein n=1 Tax=Candidatus Minimicrobia naudis TaxID=2841263 RepID=A0A8F1SAV2_9BACT|nr:hypothetical protein KOY48_03540 [Candidatus Minimicrobia naudis]